MLKIFSLTGFYGVTVFCFSVCTIGLCVSLYICMFNLSHAWNYCSKKRMIVISSSFLEDAARKWLLCILWLVTP